MRDEGLEKLNEAYASLEREAPGWLSRAIRWLRDPHSRWVRLPIGLLLMIGGFFSFLPILGVELIPLGLLILAQDIPVLRKPVGNMTIWLVRKWMALRDRWKRRRQRK